MRKRRQDCVHNLIIYFFPFPSLQPHTHTHKNNNNVSVIHTYVMLTLHVTKWDEVHVLIKYNFFFILFLCYNVTQSTEKKNLFLIELNSLWKAE